jgi:protein-S-isoprenylcysteine O-methyltransferase Ste14
MSANSEHTSSSSNNELNRAIRKRMIQVIAQWIIMAAVLFLAAGTLKWLAAWMLFVVQGGVLLFNTLYILPRNPEAVAERSEIKAGTKAWDRILTGLIGLSSLALLIICGFDYRFGWTEPYALWINTFGLAFVAIGNVLFSWALASNKFFATTVRIQDERSHEVATAGPYRYVRHPGYVGYITFSLATPVGLGTLWGLIPASLIAIGMVVRTAMEDNTLNNELEGYSDYASHVRYRLLPGIW